MTTKDSMRKVRKKRIFNKECTRCGVSLDTESLLMSYRTCNICRLYLNKYRAGKISNSCNTTYFYNRTYYRGRLCNTLLSEKIIKDGKSLKELSLELGLTSRTIERALYTNLKLSKSTELKLSNYMRG